MASTSCTSQVVARSGRRAPAGNEKFVARIRAGARIGAVARIRAAARGAHLHRVPLRELLQASCATAAHPLATPADAFTLEGAREAALLLQEGAVISGKARVLLKAHEDVE